MFENLVKKLSENNKTISTMESCTGGGIVNEFTNVEGASKVIKFSCVTYSNFFKIKMGVDADIIDKYSVYSMETANEMSKNISRFANSNYGIGVTGKLNRKDDENKFGLDNTVFISIYDKDNNFYINDTVEVSKDSREENKKQVLEKVKEMLEEIL